MCLADGKCDVKVTYFQTLCFPGGSDGKEFACNAGNLGSISGWEDPLEEGLATHSSILGLHWCSDSKESTCNVGDLGSVPRLGRSSGGVQGNPLQYSCLENPHGQSSLAAYSPWGHKESDMTEQLSTIQQ